ncbi:MAG: SprB repeat-containing protein [Saprospiraceae bacterium]
MRTGCEAITSYTVGEEAITLNPSGTDVDDACNGTNSGSITVTVSGGVLAIHLQLGRHWSRCLDTDEAPPPVCTHNGNRCKRLRSDHELHGRRRRDYAQPKWHGC